MSKPRTFVFNLDKAEAALLQSDVLAGLLADRMLADPQLRDRVEKAAAKAIDRTIAKMIEAKVTGVLDDVADKPIPSGYGGSFILREFLQGKVAEWAGVNNMRLHGLVQDLVRIEVEHEVDAVREDMRKEVRSAATKAIGKFNRAISQVFKATMLAGRKP